MPHDHHHDHHHGPRPGGIVAAMHAAAEGEQTGPIVFHNHPTPEKRELRLSVLAASGISENVRDRVAQNNTLITAGLTAAYTGLSYHNEDPYLATGLALAAPLVMNDIVRNFMDAAGRLENKGIISRQTTAAVGSFMHAGSEIFSAGANAVRGFAGADTGRALALNLTSTFTSQVSHLGTMFFGAAAIGRMGFVNRQEWMAHLKGITGLTAGLGVPIVADTVVQAIPNGFAQGAANVVNRGAGAIVSYKSAAGYMEKLHEFGDECLAGCTHDHHHHHHHHDHSHPKPENADELIRKELLLAKFSRAVQALPKTTKDYVRTILQRMNAIPAQTSLRLKQAGKTAKRIVTDRSGIEAIASIGTLSAISWPMLYNIDVLSQGFALTTSAKGALHNLAHSTPETLFIYLAALSGDRKMAIGAFGGCMASMGVLGGALLASGADIAESMRGTLMMTSYLVAPAAALAFSHPDVMKVMAKPDEAASQWITRKFGDRMKGVSNWLRNDGTSVARWIAVPATAAAFAATLAMSSQNCHTHLDGSVDCGNPQGPEIVWD